MDVIICKTSADAEKLAARMIADAINAKPEFKLGLATGATMENVYAELSRLNQAGVTLFRTDEMGTVLAYSDGREITFTWDNQSAQPDQAEVAEMTYIGNKNSKKLHGSKITSLKDSLQKANEKVKTQDGPKAKLKLM